MDKGPDKCLGGGTCVHRVVGGHRRKVQSLAFLPKT